MEKGNKKEIRELKNLKGYRQKPTIYGLNTAGFIITFIILIGGIMSLTAGIHLVKLILILVSTGLSYIINLALASNQTIKEFLFDEKLPEKFSDDE
ncbi:hypothetical protein [Chryseobacterium sp. SL1]|uniref:hypothetical protein n=1 Tax=Chryseobacterium sp. SL1 TaxID=2995159 RepID=UPI002274B8CB|nr:hypothetical protein [Chryseobacterium sp. SL1]MCY1659315.1 hypothetical protein [Chryseobacterium sp. SL1]